MCSCTVTCAHACSWFMAHAWHAHAHDFMMTCSCSWWHANAHDFMRMNIHGHGMTWSRMSMVHRSCYVSHAILKRIHVHVSCSCSSIMSMLHTSMLIFVCLFSCIPPKLNMLHPNVRKVCSSSCTHMFVHDHVHVHVRVCCRASRLSSEQTKRIMT